jgi:hypothetical protein
MAKHGLYSKTSERIEWGLDADLLLATNWLVVLRKGSVSAQANGTKCGVPERMGGKVAQEPNITHL